ncbi:hypothetical protein [Rothia uropygialis]|uniref:hypothetical protein n=1 Tax=Kocuria sp. 36 TaxID=1415402 RepID=UPI00101DDCD4|nr:hypothetical protein [Kocuria sp. 36]
MNFLRRFFTLIFAPLAAAIFSFASLWIFETDAPLIANHVLWIATDINDPEAKTPATNPELIRRLEDQARNRHLNIAKFLDNPESPASGAELQLLITNPEHHSQRLLDNGYSPFNPGYVVTVKPWNHSENDPRSFYFLYGDAHSMKGLDDELGTPGYKVQQYEIYSPREVLERNTGSPLSLAFSASLITASCFSFATALVGSKKIARLRLAGWSIWRILGRDLRSGAIPLIAAFLATAGVAGAALYFYNGLASFGIYLAVYAAFTALFIATALACRLGALGLLCLVPVPATLTGKRPVRSLYALLCLLEISCVVLLLASISSWSEDYGLAASHRRAHEQWQATPKAAFLPVAGSTWSEAEDKPIEDWLASELQQRNVIISYSDVRQRDENADAVIESSYPIVYVNPEYLKYHKIQGVSDRLVVEDVERSKTTQAFVPRGAPTEDLTADALIPGVDLRDLKISATDTTGEVFTHGDLDNFKREFAENPIVVVVPDQVLIDDPSPLTSWVTLGGVLLEDSEAAADRLRGSAAEHYVAPMSPGLAHQAHALKLTIVSLQATGFAIVVYAVLVAFSSLAFAATYAAARKDQLFRRQLFGWRPLVAAWPALSGLGAVWFSIPVFTWLLIQQAMDPMALITKSSAEVRTYIEIMSAAGLIVGAVVLLLSSGGIVVFAHRAIQERGRIQ